MDFSTLKMDMAFLTIIAIMIIGLLTVILTCLTQIAKEVKQIKQHIARIQQRNLSEHDQEIVELLTKGKKILAIKKAREHYGLGLKEATDYVEHLQS